MSSNAPSSELRALQELLWRLITAPEGAAEGVAAERALPSTGLEAIIAGDDRLSALERVEIYANMYFHRLIDILREDFPATLAVVGADNFHNLVTGYLLDYPPTRPSVLYAGVFFPDYLETHPLRETYRFIADLARLERALIDAFHAADAAPLTAEQMRATAVSEWPELPLRTHPSVRLLDLDWKVDGVLHAVEADRAWEQPASANSAMLVWRHESHVNCRPLDQAAERNALVRARDGASFAAICDAVAVALAGGEEAPSIMRELLDLWLCDGLLVCDRGGVTDSGS